MILENLLVCDKEVCVQTIRCSRYATVFLSTDCRPSTECPDAVIAQEVTCRELLSPNRSDQNPEGTKDFGSPHPTSAKAAEIDPIRCGSTEGRHDGAEICPSGCMCAGRAVTSSQRSLFGCRSSYENPVAVKKRGTCCAYDSARFAANIRASVASACRYDRGSLTSVSTRASSFGPPRPAWRRAARFARRHFREIESRLAPIVLRRN